MQNLLAEYLETPNLIIRNSIVNDTNELQAICNGWEDKKYIEGEVFDENYIEQCLLNGDLPPQQNACKTYYRLKTVCSKTDLKIIGFFDLYYGYPEVTTLWISILLIRNEMQKLGFGHEIIETVSQQAREKGYASIGIGVHLKNWKGLRFWSKNGFDKITGISGDYVFGENNFSVIRLIKNL